MSKTLKISMVSYLNSKPFLRGLELSGLMDDIELHLEVPAKTTEKLMNNEVDIALVPTATLPQLTDFHLITDYCIGANKAVDSVFLFSDTTIERINTIYLDSHSKTSVNLIQILCRDYWKKQIHFVHNSNVSKEMVLGNTACLMIGDKALELKNSFRYQYDLASAWNQFTGLPFVFAVWVANARGASFEKVLNYAFGLGTKKIPELASFFQAEFPEQDLLTYFTHSIDYKFDKQKAKALDLFLQLCKKNVNQFAS